MNGLRGLDVIVAAHREHAASWTAHGIIIGALAIGVSLIDDAIIYTWVS